MDQQLENLIRSIMPKWDDQDFMICEEIKKTMKTPGWTAIENLYKDFDLKLRTQFKTISDNDNVNKLYKIAGVMEGIDTMADLPYRVLREEEEQKKILDKQKNQTDEMLEEVNRYAP